LALCANEGHFYINIHHSQTFETIKKSDIQIQQPVFIMHPYTTSSQCFHVINVCSWGLHHTANTVTELWRTSRKYFNGVSIPRPAFELPRRSLYKHCYDAIPTKHTQKNFYIATSILKHIKFTLYKTPKAENPQ